MKSILKTKAKKGQLPAAIAFAGMAIVFLFLAPILLKIVVTPLTKVNTAFQAIDSTNNSARAVTTAMHAFTNTLDWIMVLSFIFSIVLLMITSFLVDVHPAFLVIYIIGLIFLVMFTPSIMDSVNMLWSQAQMANPDSAGGDTLHQYLPMLEFIKDNYMLIILGVLIINGIVMFGKYRFSGGGANYR